MCKSTPPLVGFALIIHEHSFSFNPFPKTSLFLQNFEYRPFLVCFCTVYVLFLHSLFFPLSFTLLMRKESWPAKPNANKISKM